MTRLIEGKAGDAPAGRIGIVASRYNSLVTDALVAGATEACRRLGLAEDRFDVVRVPGALEIPLAAAAMAKSGRYIALACLGAILRGETDHHDHVASVATKGIGEIMRDHGIPVAHGILSCDSLEQALQRAGGKLGNKGAEAVTTALEMASLMARIKAGN